MTKRKIFQPSVSDPWRSNAVIGGHFADATSCEITFSESAKLLGEKAIETGLLDFYFYPMCFLFRHAFELTLKSLVLDAERLLAVLNQLGETNVPTDLARLAADLRSNKKAHSLKWLLQQLEPRLSQIPGCEAIPPRIRDAVIELDSIDPSGETFRYSLARSGKKHFPDVSHIDVQRVKEELSEAHSLLLYGLGTWLFETRTAAAEMMDDLSAEMEQGVME
jgi:hypothetical protein